MLGPASTSWRYKFYSSINILKLLLLQEFVFSFAFTEQTGCRRRSRIANLDLWTRCSWRWCEQQSWSLRRYCAKIFSHEAVEGILLWGFWDQAHWRPECALAEGPDVIVCTLDWPHLLIFFISWQCIDLQTFGKNNWVLTSESHDIFRILNLMYRIFSAQCSRFTLATSTVWGVDR